MMAAVGYSEIDRSELSFQLTQLDQFKLTFTSTVHDDKGKPFTVRYDAVNAMLLNEFLKEHRNVAEQESTIAELKTTVAQQQKQIEALAAGLQKVSAAVELNKPRPTQVADTR
jgi:uncharacterized coiled-coil protein SlyX